MIRLLIKKIKELLTCKSKCLMGCWCDNREPFNKFNLQRLPE